MRIIHLSGSLCELLVPSSTAFAPRTCCRARRSHSIRMPISPARPKIGGRPAGFPPSALNMRQSAYKPGSGWHADCYTRLRDGHSSWAPVTRRLQQPTRTAGSGHRSRRHALAAPHRPYSVLLPVGFAVPPALPPARCALTAPFHPCCAPLPLPPPRAGEGRGGGGSGLFSVALSLGSRPPDVIRHRLSMEPGLSSPCPSRPRPASGRGAWSRSGRPAD
jgi:hypothetical protein